jgi:8-oxo-dGTP pyrophosphatase MutT (NUDIX family)
MKRSAVVAVTGPTGLVLTLRRSASDPWKPHHWNFPGGGVAKHESLTEGAVRELYEESGILVQPYSLRPLFYFYPRKGHQVAVFATTLNTYPAVSFADGEHDDFKWSSFNNLPSPSIPLFDKVARAVALRLLDTQSNIEDGKQGDQTMSRHYNTSEYMAHWPLAIPYPYEITRSRRPVPNASSVNWPQAQFAPLYLKAGSPSFQPYKYRSKPERYPPGADVFSIFPGPNTLRYSTEPTHPAYVRWGMRRADGDLAAVPGTWPPFRQARRNGSAGADVWTASDTLNTSADKAWGNALSGNCQSAYLARQADANKAWDAAYKASNKLGPVLHVQKVAMQVSGRGKYVQSVKAAQKSAEACMATEAAGRKEEEFQMLRDHKVETQQTSADQGQFQTQLMGREEELIAAEKRTKMITYGVVATLILGGGLLAWRSLRG